MMRPTRPSLFAALAVTAGLYLTAPVSAQPGTAQPAAPPVTLTADQQKILGELDPDVVADMLAAAEQAAKWKARLDAIRKQVEQAKKAGDDLAANGAKSDTATKLFLEMAQFLQKRSPKFRQQVKFADQLLAKVKAAEDAARAAKFDAEQYLDLDEAEFRANVRNLALAVAAHELLKNVDKDLFGYLELMRNPAQYARDFVENEIKKKYLDKPYPFGDVVFKLTQKDFHKSVFSPDANLTLVLAYQAAGVELKASGLYFKYAPGKPPQPVFDKVKVESASVDALANKALKSLGDELPDFGLPIKITNPKFSGFDSKDAAKRGTLSFGVVIGLDDSLGFGSADLVKVTADVTISTKGKVEVTSLGGTIKGTVPIGTTGLILDGGMIKIKPKDKKETVTLGTWIAPAAAGKDSISLEVQISFGFPITKTGLAYKGTFVVGRGTPAKQVLGTVDGVISKEKVTGHFVSGAGMAYKMDCKFELNREALTAHGDLEALFGVRKITADLYIGFDGNGRFTASDKFEVARAVHAQSSLAGSWAPGFKKLQFEGMLSLDVECQPLGTFGAVVKLTAVTDPKPLIRGTGTVGDVSVQFEATDFGAVYDALKKALLKKRDDLFRYFAEREKAARKYGAEREKALHNWVYQRAAAVGLDKLSLDKGGPIDATLGKTSQELKAAGKTLSDWREAAGGGLAHAGQQAGKEGEKIGKNLEGFANDPVGTTSHVLGFGRGLDLTDVPGVQPRGSSGTRIGKIGGANAGFELGGSDVDHALKDHIKQLDKAVQDSAGRARVNARMTKVLDALEKERINKTKHGRTGEASELRIRFDRAISHPDGADVVITFAVQVNSFKHVLDPKKAAAKPSAASDLGVVEVRVRGAFGRGQPKVEVTLPKLKNTSGWDAEALIRDTVIALVHKHLGDGGSRFEERALAAHNATDEPIRVWVQVERHQKGGWVWLPDGHGPDKRAYQFTIAAGKTFSLNATAGTPIIGRAVRLWAESESGRVWVKNLRKDELLVDEKDETGANRYYSDKIEHFVYTFSASEAPRTFRERVVVVRNATGVPVTAHAAALSRDPDGKVMWDQTVAAGVRIEPGATVKLRQANGWLLRGAEVKVWAEGEKGKPAWTKYRTTEVKMVGPQGYSGKAIASFLCVLELQPTKAGEAELHIQPESVAPKPNPAKPEPPKPEPPKPNPLKPEPPKPEPPKPHPMAVPSVQKLTLDAAHKKIEEAGMIMVVVVGKDTIPPAKYGDYRKGWHVASQTTAVTTKLSPQKVPIMVTTVICTLAPDPKPPIRRDP